MSITEGRILVIGESCNDVFIYGTCDRICPEAPVPVLVPTRRIENGGMAMNVYENIKSIYPNVDIVTNDCKIEKIRYVDQVTNQMLVRVDTRDNPVDRIKNLTELKLTNYNIIIISDYCKGFLNEQDIAYICNNHPTVFIDTKKILGDFCVNAKIIKINNVEYNNNIKAKINMSKFEHNLVVTLGNRGCRYRDNIYPVDNVEIKDMSGAGDTFISAFSVEYLRSGDVGRALEFANKCATIIVQQKGVNRIGDYLQFS